MTLFQEIPQESHGTERHDSATGICIRTLRAMPLQQEISQSIMTLKTLNLYQELYQSVMTLRVMISVSENFSKCHDSESSASASRNISTCHDSECHDSVYKHAFCISKEEIGRYPTFSTYNGTASQQEKSHATVPLCTKNCTHLFEHVLYDCTNIVDGFSDADGSVTAGWP